MNTVAESNKKEADNAISEFYQKLNEAISESEKKARERFKGVCDIQQHVVTGYNVFLLSKLTLRNNLMKCMKNFSTANSKYPH